MDRGLPSNGDRIDLQTLPWIVDGSDREALPWILGVTMDRSYNGQTVDPLADYTMGVRSLNHNDTGAMVC